MAAIETGDPAPFAAYMSQYRNTICGRHPIGVLLNMLQHAATRFTVCLCFYLRCLAFRLMFVLVCEAVIQANGGWGRRSAVVLLAERDLSDAAASSHAACSDK